MTIHDITVQRNPHIKNAPEEPEPLTETIVLEKPDFEPKRTIVIPVDHSKHSEYTIQWAIDNILKENDLVVLLNARAQPFEFQSFHNGVHPDSTALDFYNHKSLSHSSELIQQYGKKLTALGIKTQGISMAGDPRYVVVEKIRQLQPHLVLIGQRGMGAFSRAILGSVSDYIVHHAHVPVTVVSQPIS
jgi:nucleotide-binding universal stress UspA family protein